MFKEIQNTGIYRSFVDDENKVFCMDYNPIDTERYNNRLLDYAYGREIYYLKRLNKYCWCPELLDHSDNERKVYFRWYNNTCEDYLPNNFAEQLLRMVEDLHREGIYKPAFYQKFFYTDNYNIMHGFTYYSCTNYDEQPFDMEILKPILHGDRLELINRLSVDGKLDFKLLVEQAFTDYIRWPGNVLKQIYKEVYANR